MTAIEPFKVNASGPADVVNALGGIGQAVGSAFGGIGMGSRTRAAVKMHQDQMVHEAQMQQKAHELNLELIDHVTNASKTMDTHQQELRERNRRHVLDNATSFVTGPDSPVRGGSRVDMQETAEGGHRLSFTAGAKKKPAASKPRAPKAAVTTATKVIDTVPAPKKTRAKKTSTNTEIINTVAPGEQYND